MTNSISLEERREVIHIDDVKPSEQSDRECMDDVRSCLDDYDKTNRFGLFLMHDHFKMTKDEILIEEGNTETREIQIKVINRNELQALNEIHTVVETSWNLHSNFSIKSRWNIDKENHIRPESVMILNPEQSIHYVFF